MLIRSTSLAAKRSCRSFLISSITFLAWITNKAQCKITLVPRLAAYFIYIEAAVACKHLQTLNVPSGHIIHYRHERILYTHTVLFYNPDRVCYASLELKLTRIRIMSILVPKIIYSQSFTSFSNTKRVLNVSA